MAKPVDVLLAPFVVHLVLLVLYFDFVKSLTVTHAVTPSLPPVPLKVATLGALVTDVYFINVYCCTRAHAVNFSKV